MKSLMPQIDSNDGLFHNGNPATGEQGTRVTDTWLNDVQDRVRDVQAEAHYVLGKAGFKPVENKQTQLYEAIVKIIDDNRKSASTTQKGEVRLTSDTGLDSEELGLTAKAGKKLAQLIATVQVALNNYIPLNKRSSAVNSNDENNVATSKAVKTAYDKGVEAKTAADNAQRSANAANNNANGRVSKSGDTMTGSLAITGSQSGSFASGLMLKNKAGGQNTSVFVDFYQTDNIPRASMWMRDAGNNSTQIEFLNTPEGADWNIDSRQNVFTITSAGNLWSKSYGWIHDYFAKQADNTNIWNWLNNHAYKFSDVGGAWYPEHYSGCQTFRFRISKTGGMLVTILSLQGFGPGNVWIPEKYTGFAQILITDDGDAKYSYGARMVDQNHFYFSGRGRNSVAHIVIIGWSDF